MSPKGKFYIYLNSARYRGHEFCLTFEEFMLFWKKPCYYCDAEISLIGLDRVDNSRGYAIGNVVSCCKVCNVAKARLSQDEFFRWCGRVALKHEMKVKAVD